MKLRLRSLETKQTHRIEAPSPCSLPHLKQLLLSQSLPSLPADSSIHLSLNRSTELVSSSPDESIQSLGVTSGDLIYFTLNPNAFSPPPAPYVQFPNPRTETVTPNCAENKTLISQPVNCETLELGSTQKEKTLELGTPMGETLELGSTQKEKTLELDTQMGETLELDETQRGTELDNEIGETSDNMEEDIKDTMDIGKSFSVPGFLRKVFTEELGDDSGRHHKLLVIAVHAVLLESGFISFDPLSKTIGCGIHAPGEWPAGAFMMSLCYTLPDIISDSAVTGHGIENGKVLHSVILKFHTIGKFFCVCGYVSNGNGMHSMRVDEERLIPFLNVVWANCGLKDEYLVGDGLDKTSPEREVYEFWRRVKDELALPLLIDLCEKAGLELPPCFMRLPTEITLKILESLPGVDIAKVGSLCRELRYLTAQQELWSRKYVEEFGNGEGSKRVKNWKEQFKVSFESRKMMKKLANGRGPLRHFYRDRIQIFPQLPGLGPFPPYRRPGIIGGDYDLMPNLGPFGPGAFTQHIQQRGAFPRNRNTVPHCNLEG